MISSVTAVGVAFLFLSVFPVAGLRNRQLPSGYNCMPGMSCFPSAEEWQAFNQSIGGHLRATVPWAKPCFSSLSFGTSFDPDQCSYIESHYADSPPLEGISDTVGPDREAQYGSMQNLQWETCGAADCLLQSAAPNIALPLLRNCSLGRLSAYYVNASQPSHVTASIKFCNAHKLRMTIKNTGCDYLGRASGANSLALWTHNMNNLEYHPNFVSSNCPAVNQANIGVMGAGVVASNAEDFFTSHGMDITAGAVGSVGLAGGFGQGGGHGVFGPTYGLMVDNAVEFDVVTADGVQRTINQCNDPDLFYAMRGGGGSTYAVLLNYKFKVHPTKPLYAYLFQANFSLVQDLTKGPLYDLLTALATNQTYFSNNSIAGYNFYYEDRVESYNIMPSSDPDAMNKFKAITKAYHDYLTNYPGLSIEQNEYITFPNQTAFATYTIPIGVRNTPEGYAEALSGRLIPRTLFKSSSIPTLVEAFITGMQISQNPLDIVKPIPAMIYATGPANHDDNSQTGVNPAWRGSLWEVVFGGGWVQGVPQALQDKIQSNVQNGMDTLRNLTPGGGCYMNEASYTEVDWQTAFFGSNYNRLLSIKNTYDPNNFFNCWRCVGWTGADDPIYSCYAQSMNPLIATVPL